MKTIVAAGTFLLMFWNVENFFEEKQCYRKCNSIAKTILQAADGSGRLPDVIGLAEIENMSVLQKLLHWTSLSKFGYSIIHYDSPDRRGIDCALLYRKAHFKEICSKPCHIYDSCGRIMPTRDILLAVLEPLAPTSRSLDPSSPESLDPSSPESLDPSSPESLTSAPPGPIAVLVNHHPSKLGSGSDDRRKTAMDRLLFLRDSLLAEGIERIIAVGDFNDTVVPADGVESAYGPGEGTIKFQGQWDKIDGCPVLEGLRAKEYIFHSPQAMVEDRTYSGTKPLRSFSGPRFLGGPSDHLPVLYIVNY